MSRLFFVFLVSCTFSSCYFFKAIKYKKYKLEDISNFPQERFEKSAQPFQFIKGNLPFAEKLKLDSMLIGSNKYGFAIIRNDSILYEFYNENITDSSMLPSFSVAKSFVSTMVGMANEEGKIKSLDEPITNYLPELKKRDPRFGNITIQHVLDMRSGIKSSENYYNPFSDVLRMGFGRNLEKKALNISIETEPNLSFEYKSINTQLLAIIVERATGKKLQDYFREKIQSPLQMEYTGTWIYDDEKHKELKAFCCMNFALRDYAKFGKLYLDNGVWNGKNMISKSWVDRVSNADSMAKYDGYNNQFWQWGHEIWIDSSQIDIYKSNYKDEFISVKDSIYFKSKNKKVYVVERKSTNYYARGLLNQYIIISPKNRMIVVHFGNSQNPNSPLKPGFEGYLRNLIK